MAKLNVGQRSAAQDKEALDVSKNDAEGQGSVIQEANGEIRSVTTTQHGMTVITRLK